MLERIEINLLPADYRFRSKSNIAGLQREVIYPLLFDILLVTVLGLWLVMINAQMHEYQSKIATVEAEIAANQYIQAEITKLEQSRGIILEKIRALERIDVNREKWVRLMETFCRSLPDQMWLQSVVENETSPNQLEIGGQTYSFPEVANFMSRLSGGVGITTVDLVNIELVKGPPKTFGFAVSCTINPDARLDSTQAAAVSVP
jgi:Tfp pilus assembly protein PilN